MSRNTHDRALDHHGADSAANVALESALAGYPAGTLLTAIIADLAARVAFLETRDGLASFGASAVVFRTMTGTLSLSGLVRKTQSSTFTISAEISS